MNFNQKLKAFEFDCIHDTFNLLKFAGRCGIQFHFVSSIASGGSGVLKVVEEEPLPRRANVALPQGYGQSKYVAEHLCWAAMDLLGVPVNVYRLGQISGDTQNGVWNSTEMASMMIYAGAGQLKKLPDMGDDLRWLPVDVCSASLVELALQVIVRCGSTERGSGASSSQPTRHPPQRISPRSSISRPPLRQCLMRRISCKLWLHGR